MQPVSLSLSKASTAGTWVFLLGSGPRSGVTETWGDYVFCHPHREAEEASLRKGSATVLSFQGLGSPDGFIVPQIQEIPFYCSYTPFFSIKL